MNLLFILVIILLLIIFLIVLLNTLGFKGAVSEIRSVSNHQSPKQQEHTSRAGVYHIDISPQQQLYIHLSQQGLIQADQTYQLTGTSRGTAPYLNRYTYYNFDFGLHTLQSTQEKYLPLTLYLKHKKLEFLRTSNVVYGRRADELVLVEFTERWSEPQASIEQAFADFKQHIQWFYEAGAKIFHAVDEVRFHKRDYAKVLTEEGYCIAPEYLTLEEFKAGLQHKNSYGLDICFYIDEVVINLDYEKSYQVTHHIFRMDNLDSQLSYFGEDDVYLDLLSEDEKRAKFEQMLSQNLQTRHEAEHTARQQGYVIDEDYIDPYIRALN